MGKSNSLPPKQIIDSFEGIVDHIVQYHLDDGMRQHFLDIEEKNLFEFHWSFGMFIRNTYELSDPEKVPNLVEHYKRVLITEAGEDPDLLTSESEPLYYFLLTGLLGDDGLSRHILKLIWRRLNTEHRG